MHEFNFDAELEAQAQKDRNLQEEMERRKQEQASEHEAKIVADALAAGKALFAKEQWAEAEQHFDVALNSGQIEKRHEVVCNRAACALKRYNFSDALADASEAVALEPSYVKGHWRQAMAFRGLGKLDRAIGACEKALPLQPESKQLTRLLTELQEQAANAAATAATEAMALESWTAHCNEAMVNDVGVPTVAKEDEAARKARTQAELAKLGWDIQRAAGGQPDYGTADPSLGTVATPSSMYFSEQTRVNIT